MNELTNANREDATPQTAPVPLVPLDTILRPGIGSPASSYVRVLTRMVNDPLINWRHRHAYAPPVLRLP
jgi:hypothetical protein